MRKIIVMNVGEDVSLAKRALNSLSEIAGIRCYTVFLCFDFPGRECTRLVRDFAGKLKVIIISYRMWRLDQVFGEAGCNEFSVIDLNNYVADPENIKEVFLSLRARRDDYLANDSFLFFPLRVGLRSFFDYLSRLPLSEVLEKYRRLSLRDCQKRGFLVGRAEEEVDKIERIMKSKNNLTDGFEEQVMNRLRNDIVNYK